MSLIAFFISVFFIFSETQAVPIETPDIDERSDFVVRSPEGWGYRTFQGKNGLIGVFWPVGTSFNMTDTAIFVFLQDSEEPLPEIPDNINLFTEKCTKAAFNFSQPDNENPTQSLAETYFSGRCGRTMIIMKEEVKNYKIILALVSAKPYITKDQLSDFKDISHAYKREAEKYTGELTTEDNNSNNNAEQKNQNNSFMK